ncbi:hypothetical protein DYU05_05485 [Mucilaginibacter terrenus]|uniref:Uncharacterized protein n=1 Tax=Mucilaginibacter terrenus TaxID=2482727 RepID=A0A3E2NVM2_9SPHI|nr:hypothetical protein [Mucilaginibacter terrenus]RFZ85058.1 hypothetical protein DYU05_05485 [Mucilaginibacter terrenus]
MTDEQFREEYKPLHVPAAYHNEDTLQDKIIYALGQIGEGTPEDVLAKLEELEPGLGTGSCGQEVQTILYGLFDRGLLTGREVDAVMLFNLHKITRSNEGAVDPDLLAPGLD